MHLWGCQVKISVVEWFHILYFEQVLPRLGPGHDQQQCRSPEDTSTWAQLPTCNLDSQQIKCIFFSKLPNVFVSNFKMYLSNVKCICPEETSTWSAAGNLQPLWPWQSTNQITCSTKTLPCNNQNHHHCYFFPFLHIFSCTGSSIPTLEVATHWPPLYNLDTKSVFWDLRPFRLLIRVISRQKNKKTNRRKDETKKRRKDK